MAQGAGCECSESGRGGGGVGSGECQLRLRFSFPGNMWCSRHSCLSFPLTSFECHFDVGHLPSFPPGKGPWRGKQSQNGLWKF